MGRPLAARSLTPEVRAWLHRARQVRILHIFDRACNLFAPEAGVISIVTPDIGNGPFNLVIQTTRFAPHVSVADRVRWGAPVLEIGRLAIDVTPASEWNPAPDWARLRRHRDRLHAAFPLLQAVLSTHAPGSKADLPPLEAALSKVMQAHREDFITGLKDNDRQRCLASAVQLAGLGGGLTPAGDDWLLGCVLVAYAGLPSDRAHPLACQAAKAAAQRTTPLSAAWLRAASQGKCSVWWHTLFAACLDADENAIMQAANHIARQGHTSGTDALAGFVALLGEN